MQYWAAIDILGGKVVTLKKGDPSSAACWPIDAGKAASRWEDEGADGLHVVDLDGAFGNGPNLKEIGSVLRTATIPVEVGGGIRTPGQARRLLEMGASRIVVGTAAYSHDSTLQEIASAVGPTRVSVAVDLRKDKVLTNGWRGETQIGLFEALERFERLGIKTAVVTDAGRDGMASGPNTRLMRRVRKSTGLELIASGGIRSLEDIRRLEALGMDGTILGRSLYDGSVDLGELRRR